MRYVDTSVLVSLVTPEDTSDRAVAWLQSTVLGTLHVSEWVTAEVAAALTRKVRTHRLSIPDRDRAFQRYLKIVEGSFAIVPVEASHLRKTIRIVSDATAGIRVGDALHLALAASRELELSTTDKRLAVGARQLGYAVELITG